MRCRHAAKKALKTKFINNIFGDSIKIATKNYTMQLRIFLFYFEFYFFDIFPRYFWTWAYIYVCMIITWTYRSISHDRQSKQIHYFFLKRESDVWEHFAVLSSFSLFHSLISLLARQLFFWEKSTRHFHAMTMKDEFPIISMGLLFFGYTNTGGNFVTDFSRKKQNKKFLSALLGNLLRASAFILSWLQFFFF